MSPSRVRVSPLAFTYSCVTNKENEAMVRERDKSGRSLVGSCRDKSLQSDDLEIQATDWYLQPFRVVGEVLRAETCFLRVQRLS